MAFRRGGGGRGCFAPGKPLFHFENNVERQVRFGGFPRSFVASTAYKVEVHCPDEIFYDLCNLCCRGRQVLVAR